ncbi:IS630 family transposase, partial [Arthrobacter sp. AQ5-05]|uniref:IS630 family transposase n=1 Tax=Arthrobacter sp. AQ5-05 TaxID=2184581 RepID=UPI000DCCE1BB
MRTPQLSDEERQLLKKYKANAPHKLVVKKAEALLLLSRDVAPEVVAEFVDREPSTLDDWVTDWNRQRMASLLTGHAGNLNRSFLTEEQREAVTQVLSQPPGEEYLPAEFWDVPKLDHWLSTTFDVEYASNTSYHFLLRMAGLSFHKPEKFDRRRADEKVIDLRVKEIRAELVAPLADADTLVFAADEVRIDQEAVVRKAWYEKNTKTVLKVDRKRASQSFIGFLNQDSGECVTLRLDWQNSATILEAVQTLVGLNPGKKIVIVWDNASWHKNKLIRAELAKGQTLQDVHLINFPPYAPDHNPIEHVWNDAKNAISNVQRNDFESTVTSFEAHVR